MTTNIIMSTNNGNQMVDFHTHILPEMDDGAYNPTESMKMLEVLSRQGVGAVCLTPHFYPYKENIETFLQRRGKAIARIAPYAQELGIRLVLASETYLSDYLFNTEDISELCMGKECGRRYLLTELPSGFSERTIKRVSRLIFTYNVVPILAHIDRYPKLIKSSVLLDEFIDMGCLMQMNLESLQEGFLKKRKLLKYIQSNMVHVVGTDAHNMSERPPVYSKGISVIAKALGEGAVNQLTRNALQIISES